MNNLSRPINRKALAQHLEEAAFYWMRRQDAIWNPAFNLADVTRIDQLLAANLNGTRIAGAQALQPALDNLSRWKSADEAFVAMSCLLAAPDEEGLDFISSWIVEKPELIQGAAAALHWSGHSESKSRLLKSWWDSEQPHLARAAFPALAATLTSNEFETLLQSAATRGSAIQARAFRQVGEQRIETCREMLHAGLESESSLVRFESVAALFCIGESFHAAILRDCLSDLKESSTIKTINTLHRRAILYWATMSDDAMFDQWVRDANADDLRDVIWAIAFRGNPALIPLLVEWMNSETESIIAAYAICHLTGLDLEAEDFVAPTEIQEVDDDQEFESFGEENALEQTQLEDDGLLPPDREKITAWLNFNQARFATDHRILAGQPIEQVATENLVNGLQPQRWQAGLYLTARKNQTGILSRIPAFCN